MLARALVLCLCLSHAVSLRVISSNTVLEIVNGVPRHKHIATFEADEQDALVGPQPFTLTDVSGTTRRVEVDIQAPEYHYDTTLTGWIPMFQYVIESGICMKDYPTNTSVIGTDLHPGSSFDSPIGDINDFSNGAARRLLNSDNMDERDSFVEEFLSNIPKSHHREWQKGFEDGRVFVKPPRINYGKTYLDAYEKEIEQMEEESRAAARRLLGSWSPLPSSGQQWSFGLLGSIWGGWKGGSTAYREFRNRRLGKGKARKPTTEKAGGGETKANTEFPNTDQEIGTSGVTTAEQDAANSVESSATTDAVTAADTAATGAAEEAIGISVGEAFLTGGAALGGAIVAGMAADYAIKGIEHLFGGGGGSNSALKDIVSQFMAKFGRIDKELAADRQWIDKNAEILNTDQNRFKQLTEITNRLETEIEQNTQSINYVQQEVTRQGNAIETLNNRITNSNTELLEQIRSTQSEFDLFTNYSVEANEQIHEVQQKLVTQVYKMMFQTQRVQTDLFNMQTDKSMRRALIKLFHRTNSVTLPRPSAPFLTYVGAVPLNGTSYDVVNTPAGAASIGSVYFQRTVLSATVRYAQAFNLTMICDPIMLIDHIVPGMNFQSLMGLMGPENCTGASETDAWTCGCVVKIESKQCELKSPSTPHFYPWGEGTSSNGWQGATWIDDVSPSAGGVVDNCATTPVSPASSSLSAVETGSTAFPGNYLTTADEVAAWLTGFCEDPLMEADPVNAYKVQMHGSRWPRFVSLTLNTSEYADVCVGSFADLQTDQSYLAMAYSFYRLMSLNYASNLNGGLVELENHISGRIPSGLTFQEQPFNTDVKDSQTFRCVYMSYTKIGGGPDLHTPGLCKDLIDPGETCPKVRMYTDNYVGMVGKIKLVVDGVDITNSTAEAGSPEATQKHVAGLLSDSDIASEVLMSSEYTINTDAQLFLKGQFFRLGPYPGRTIATTTDTEGGTLNNQIMTIDVPWNLISGAGSAHSRMNHIDYIWQSIHTTNETDYDTPIDPTTWKVVSGTNFDSRAVTSSPHLYARRMVAPFIGSGTTQSILPNDYVCGELYEEDGTTLVSNGWNYNWCQLLRHARAEAVNNGTTSNAQIGMIYRPRQFVARFTVQVPGGTWARSILSYCPSFVNITNVTGSKDVYVVFNTTSPQPITVDVVLTDSDGECVSTYSDQTYSAEVPLVVPRIEYDAACGEIRYINVFTKSNNEPCYEAPGLQIVTTRTHFGGDNRPADVVNIVEEAQDKTVQDMIDADNRMLQYAARIVSIVNSAKTDTSVRDQINAINEERTKSWKKYSSASNRSEAIIKKAERDAQDIAENVTSELNKVRNEEEGTERIIASFTKSVVARAAMIAVLNQYTQGVDAANDADIAAENGFKGRIKHDMDELDDGAAGCGGGGILGDLMAPICDMMRWIFSAFGQLLMPILVIAGVIAAICICANVGPELCTCCCRMMPKSSTSYTPVQGGAAVAPVTYQMPYQPPPQPTFHSAVVKNQAPKLPPMPPPKAVPTASKPSTAGRYTFDSDDEEMDQVDTHSDNRTGTRAAIKSWISSTRASVHPM